MLQTTIYSLALGSFMIASGASAVSLQKPTFAPNITEISHQNIQIAQSTLTTDAVEKSVFQQINQYRASQNLPPLTRNSAIDNQARIHSQNMASGKVPFGHTGFQQRIIATGISYKAAAENVAYNQSSDPATTAVKAWLKSSGHLRNIKGNYNLTGIGVARTSTGRYYLTQIFIRT